MPKSLSLNTTMPEQKKFEILIYGTIMSILASTVTALLSNEKKPWTRVKTFLAGTCGGILLQLLFLQFDFSQGVKDVIATMFAAFISTIWPIMGNIANKYVKKKGEDIVQGN
jgi:hypothetical protein